jgi:CheY-like chemotaxis protein
MQEARVLIIDDEPAIRFMLKTALSREGCIVEECADPLKAEETISLKHYDVIFMDIRMPGMNGIEVYKKIVTRRPELGKRVVIITGDIHDKDIKAYIHENGVSWLMKPFDLLTLKQKVKDIIKTA